MKSFVERSGLATALCFITFAVTAHHSSAMFDQERELTLQGAVTEFEWVNPHVYIKIETRDSRGERVVWTVEGSSTSSHRRVGWSPESLSIGDRVSVVVNPAKNSERQYARGTSLAKEDGTLLPIPNRGSIEALSAEPPKSLKANDLAGSWLPDPSSPRSQFPRSWPLTAKGTATLESYDDSLNPFNDCIPLAAPLLVISSSSVKSIEIGEDSIVIRAGGAVRAIHMNVGSHDGATITNQGHSIGWWEDDVLVVDTTHFSDHLIAYGRGLASGAQKHLVERFSLSPDRTRLNYMFEVEDPEYLAERVTGAVELVYRPDLPNLTERCDSEIARRFLEE